HQRRPPKQPVPIRPRPGYAPPLQRRRSKMRRREFIAGLGAAITGSIRTNAQQLPPVSLVGYLYAGPTEGAVGRQVAFREGLAGAGYFEGCNLAIESRWARNASYRLPDLASDLVDRGVAV